MGDFLQLKGKVRIGDEGLLDIIKKKINDRQSPSETNGTELKQKVQEWLFEDGYLDNSPSIIKQIKPEVIGEVILQRMCDVSGHLWIEFTEDLDDNDEDDLIRAGTHPQDLNINAHVIEFIPDVGEGLFGSYSISREEFGIDWNEVTDDYLLELFSHLLHASNRRQRQPVRLRPGGARALLPGKINLITPAEIPGQPVAWFKDRAAALKTPKWAVSEPCRIFEQLQELEEGKAIDEKLGYSFTPECYETAHNCVTWANVTLLSEWSINFLETIQTHCVVDLAALATKHCDDYDIAEMGRMQCVIEYIKAAHEARVNSGLRTFTE